MRSRLLCLVLAFASPRLVSAQSGTCDVHWDCAQGEFCYKGHCLRDVVPVYHCGKPGCQPGHWCLTPESERSRCGEDETWVCATACDCGPAHACIAIDGVGMRCVKDVADAWLPGGTAIFGATIPAGEPTYCCAEPECLAGAAASGASGEFACYDRFAGEASGFCGGKKCFFAGDCGVGDSCIDIYSELPVAGDLCTESAGRCFSNAIAEAVFELSPTELRPACTASPSEGWPCEAGWAPGGAFWVSHVVGHSASCGDGTCQTWESHRTCPVDCHDCVAGGPDGRCEPEEYALGTCPQDCGTCGDGACDSLETPKLCPSDCTETCGDGSCGPSEVATCPQDCRCPGSASFTDHPSFCGDGFCDLAPASLERCETCSTDCPPSMFHPDDDGDGFGNAAQVATACAASNVVDATDCDDGVAAIYPGAPERCNGNDDDCDGEVDEGGYRVLRFEPPLRPGTATSFKAGATIPVKVVVVDCAGIVLPAASVTIALDPPFGDVEGAAFRYDPAEGQFVFNLPTRAFPPRSYSVSAVLGNGDRATAEFTLR